MRHTYQSETNVAMTPLLDNRTCMDDPAPQQRPEQPHGLGSGTFALVPPHGYHDLRAKPPANPNNRTISLDYSQCLDDF